MTFHRRTGVVVVLGLAMLSAVLTVPARAGDLVQVPNLTAPQRSMAAAIDVVCPKLVAAGFANQASDTGDLTRRCREMRQNANANQPGGGATTFSLGLTNDQLANALGQLTNVLGTGLPPGSETITGATTITGSEQNLESVVAGAYVEQTLDWDERLFVTGALRGDHRRRAHVRPVEVGRAGTRETTGVAFSYLTEGDARVYALVSTAVSTTPPGDGAEWWPSRLRCAHTHKTRGEAP